jgi:hypothetical protein
MPILKLSVSEKCLPVELAFSDQDSKIIDSLHVMDEVAELEHIIIPVICAFIDQCIKKNDYHEVLQQLRGI